MNKKESFKNAISKAKNLDDIGIIICQLDDIRSPIFQGCIIDSIIKVENLRIVQKKIDELIWKKVKKLL